MDGDAAPHGYFADSKEARRFAEEVLEKAIGSDGLSSTSRDNRNLEEIRQFADRTAFSTDMTDSSEYRVQGGRLRAQFEGEDYDLGELREVSREEINSWSQETFQEDANFQDGEVFTVYDEDGDETGAYARFGDRYYRASKAQATEPTTGIPDREATPGVPRLLDTPAAIAVDNVPEMEGLEEGPGS